MSGKRFLDPRLGSLLVIVAIVGGAMFIAVDGLMKWRDDQAALAELEQRVQLLEDRAAELTDSDTGGRPEDAAFDRRILVFGETPGLVAAELQRTVGFIAERTGADLRSVDIAAFEDVEGIEWRNGETLQRVRLSAEFEVAEQALPDFLYNIEADYPILVVDGLTLRSTRRVASAASEMWMPADQSLNLRMTISAFWTGAPE